MRFLRHFITRREMYWPTWKLWAALLLVLPLSVAVTRGFWVRTIANDLTCSKDDGRSDALLIENFDPEYILFEEAATLQRTGIASRVLVPVEVTPREIQPNVIETGTVEMMTRIARLENVELVPVKQREPISLNAAMQVRDVLKREGIASVSVITPGYRSRRSALVYSTVFNEAGIQVRCVPVFGDPPEQWAETWHGIQDVLLQWVKLRYYQYWVLL